MNLYSFKALAELAGLAPDDLAQRAGLDMSALAELDAAQKRALCAACGVSWIRPKHLTKTRTELMAIAAEHSGAASNFISNFKQIRDHAGLSMPELAALSGVSESILYKMTSGARWPSKTTRAKILAALAARLPGLTMAELEGAPDAIRARLLRAELDALTAKGAR